ncbi:flagellar hook-associated protein FlgK [Defluviimonas sp. WL0002]|uniref:Flagellar hook-associated protein 1 n=1 Tax=Albidovulum marisflavi TaxID=2984159 RepID=A0ABT2Z7B0_9RHOB|nr:flagellar hook-associated protein FlgK [Defluviimonas sp. WL0002]MCV2867023.1 flagellar hook-associated protein FlgK [Defluviimonas sp. WL0002]
MSISSALSNALSGLTAASRRADVLSANVANALTPGYGRREVRLSALSLGGNGAGVRVEGITRTVNTTLIGDRRLADADASSAEVRAQTLKRIEDAIGDPTEPHSLSARIDDLERALVLAAGRPDSEARLQSVAGSAGALASTLQDLTREMQDIRMDADQEIARQVDLLNTTLRQIDTLNANILAQRGAGRDSAALMDQRQVLVDRLAAIVPLREVARDHDQIALFTTGGAMLLDGNPAEIGFSSVGVITPDMRLQSGALSGLTINGMAIASDETGPLRGGSLAAFFSVRDQITTDAQAQIDSLARDLIDRFSDPGTDPTLTPGSVGLFTDHGGPVVIANQAGLAGRISLNGAVDPARGGALWRIRDGIGSTAPGPSGDSTRLQALTEVMGQARIPAGGSATGVARSASDLASDVLSRISGARLAAESSGAHAAARQSALVDLELADGVDTDAEMQTLLLVEQAFAANARVIQTLDDLIQQLIGL